MTVGRLWIIIPECLLDLVPLPRFGRMEGGFVLRVVVGAVLGVIAGMEALAGVVLMSAVVDIVVLVVGEIWVGWFGGKKWA